MAPESRRTPGSTKLSRALIEKMRRDNNNTLIDHVDGSDHVIGTLARGSVIESGKNFRVVHIIIQDRQNGRILLQRLAESHMRNAHRYGSSAAGFVHAGETYKEAARRILEKELGISPSELQLLKKLSMLDNNSLKFIEVFLSRTSIAPQPDYRQVEELTWVDVYKLFDEIEHNPEQYTPTFVFVLTAIKVELLHGIASN